MRYTEFLGMRNIRCVFTKYGKQNKGERNRRIFKMYRITENAHGLKTGCSKIDTGALVQWGHLLKKSTFLVKSHC